MLQLRDQGVYHVNICLDESLEKKWVSCRLSWYYSKAIRGLNNARHITKEMFRYRPKAFIVFQIREFMRHYKMSLCMLYSMMVSMPINTWCTATRWKSLDSILCGGHLQYSCTRTTIFKLCLEEQRKLIKIKLQKRGQYRKRYGLLYEYQITNSRKFERVFE